MKHEAAKGTFERQVVCVDEELHELFAQTRPFALYARVPSDRQDVDLSVAAQLKTLRDYADKNGVWGLLRRRLFVFLVSKRDCPYFSPK